MGAGLPVMPPQSPISIPEELSLIDLQPATLLDVDLLVPEDVAGNPLCNPALVTNGGGAMSNPGGGGYSMLSPQTCMPVSSSIGKLMLCGGVFLLSYCTRFA